MAPQKSPAFSFYAKDFSTGTSTMSLQEVGAYIRLLSYQWDAGSVPVDANERARVLGCSKAQERELWKKVGRKFTLRDDVYVNDRLEEERQKQVERRQRLSDNGKLGGRPQKANGKLDESNCLNPAKANENLNERLPSSSSSSKEQKHERASRFDDRFEAWWSAYPKKTGKGAALNAWKKLRPTEAIVAQMHDALKWQRNQPQWTKDSGAYVPNPATYLNQHRWEDEPFFASAPRLVSSVPSPAETAKMIADRIAMAGK